MSFLTLATHRYTTKAYASDQKINADKIAHLQKALHLSPSSINSQPWKFTFVSDPTVKQALAAASYWNAQKIENASHLVIFSVIDNIANFEQQMEKHLPESSITYYQNFVKIKGETAIKNWFTQQVYLSLGFFLAACATMEIDSTPMEGIQNEQYDEIIQLNGYKTLFAVAIGYRALDDKNQPSITPKTRLPIENIIRTL